MKQKVILLLLLAICFISNSNAKYKFGKVTLEELQQTKSTIDEEAYAEYFLKTNKIWFSYSRNRGFIKNTQVRVVLKIYNKNEASDWANVSILKHKEEDIVGLKAITHNIKDGNQVSIKWKRKELFKEKVNDKYTRYKFTLPEVKDGSVLEWVYTISSPYKGIRKWYFQSSIPVRYSSCELIAPEYYTYQPQFYGYEAAVEREIRTGGKTLNVNGKSLIYSTQIFKYVYKNLPALKDENFVFNINNYRNSVEFELAQINFPQEPPKNFTTTWKNVAKTLMKDLDFGEQLKQKRFLKKDISELQAQLKDSPVKDKIQAALQYIRKNVKWNEKRRLYTKKGVKKAFADKEGNSAEINLLFVTVLRELGLNANPMVLSTTDNGRVNYNFPSLDQLNHTIAAIEEDGKTYMIDASNKYSNINTLPSYCLNYRGFIIQKNACKEVEIATSKVLHNTKIDCSINDLGEIEGNFYGSEYGFHTVSKREEIALNKKEQIEKIMKKDEQIIKENVVFENEKNIDQALITKYKFTDDINIQEIQDKILVTPLLFTKEKENPFKKETRKFPVELGAPLVESKFLSLKVPESYSIESLPQSKKLVLPNNLGTYLFLVGKKGNEITVQERLTLNSRIFLVQDYPSLRELFVSIMDIEKEKIVLKKN